jgi:hypothetical protein
MGDLQSRAAWAEAHGSTAMARSIARWVREVRGLLDYRDAARVARLLARPG